MRFVDEATLFIKAGDGGRGCVGFRREKYVPKGGPDGGDGGKGGDIIVAGQKSLLSLLDFKYKSHYKAEKGRIGGGSNRTGRNGKDLIIHVPVGTVVSDLVTGEVLADIIEDGQSYVAAHGGRGGRGNARFVSSVRRAPTNFDDGDKGEERKLRLELKLLATLGIIGLPNVGKSTLLSRLTSANPEIGDYPFTTLTPSLGVFSENDRSLVLADIPGVIEGAAFGKGLGLQFLRHIERTSMLLWVIDISSSDPIKDYETLHHELSIYKEEIAARKKIIVLNKTDLVSEDDAASKEARFKQICDDVVSVSALKEKGIERLRGLITEKGYESANG